MTSHSNEDLAIVSTASQAYGYNYASLADIVKQLNKPLPKMRTKMVEGVQFVEYLDTDGTWQQGAEVVVPDMKGSNAAQAYGSALTYARRYTVQLALGLACDDDQKLEKSEQNRSFDSGRRSSGSSDRPPSEKQLEYLLKLLQEDGQEVTMTDLKEKIKTAAVASATIEKYAKKN